tara:strand:+ start:175 stop:411 length:237 start_codon:yes stop_codon:yes gene_type:complete
MAMGVPHYYKDGKPLGSGGMGVYHKMKDGTLHSGKTHTKSSKRLFHFNELSKTAKDKAKKNQDTFLKKKKNGSKKITT